MRDSQTGYLVPVQDAPGALPDLESCWDAAAVVAAVTWKFKSTFWLGNYIWSFPGLGVQLRDIWTLRPGFYTEFRYKSREHSGLAWGAILRKVFVLILFPRLPCPFFQEHVPKMDSLANVPGQQGAFKYFQVPRSSKWLVFQYFQVPRSSK